jgi:PBSX family phage terminase large subunit
MLSQEYQTHYTQKRLQILKIARYPINILEGAVRSGKTYDTCTLFLEDLERDRNTKVDKAMFGKSEITINRNLLSTMEQILGPKEIKRSSGYVKIFGHRIWLQGLNDIRAVQKIKGMTINKALGDEITEWTEDQFQMINTRMLTFDDSRFWGTTNPDSPKHWLYKKYKHLMGMGIQVDSTNLVAHYVLEDNPLISPAKIAQLKRDYAGVFYLRHILGLWVIAEGLVVGEFNSNKHTFKTINLKDYKEFIGGVDFGFTNPACVGIWGVRRDNTYDLLYEHYKTNQITKDLINWINSKQVLLPKKISYVFLDPAEPDRRIEMLNAGINAYPADNDIIAGLNTLKTLFKNDQARVHESCTNFQDEAETLRYPRVDEAGYGDDKKFIGDDHAIDMARYALFSYIKRVQGLQY